MSWYYDENSFDFPGPLKEYRDNFPQLDPQNTPGGPWLCSVGKQQSELGAEVLGLGGERH